ncbi:hypothetical protein [Achromobacter aegrifaciens]|uniref:Uncharacterized protein n=1 Tax=Achromobacter aegrifaciens TaxID=1287736 RepID=A0AAD2IZ21_ACHAE|nr:hypothetical protein [Achromobacter aegrifaciens]CUJ01663.1 Uncharacterised protein [Achromobacter aegrifaciens]
MTDHTTAAQATKQDPISEAISILTADAASIRESHTPPCDRDDWNSEPETKAYYDRLLRVVGELSKLRAPVAELRIGVSATAQGATVCIMQPHSDGSMTTIYSETHTIGDSVGRAALASATVADRQRLRELVDVVWNEATASTEVPSTPWADRLIDRVFPSSLASAPVAGEAQHDNDSVCAWQVWWNQHKSRYTTTRQAAIAAFAAGKDWRYAAPQATPVAGEAIRAALAELVECGKLQRDAQQMVWSGMSDRVQDGKRMQRQYDKRQPAALAAGIAALDAAPQASEAVAAEALEVAPEALMEIADLADVDADDRSVIVNQALTKIDRITALSAQPGAQKEGASDA